MTRRAEIASGLLLVLLLAWHVWEKVETGLLPEMFWACHIATAVAAIGALAGVPTLLVFGGLFHVVVGLPAWLLELALNGTTASSTALHLVTPAVGLWRARTAGVPRWLAPAGGAFWLGAQGVGRLFGPELNINVSWHPYEVLPPAVPAWVSHALNLGLVVGALALLQWIAPRVLRG
jgi:hypothetical protein